MKTETRRREFLFQGKWVRPALVGVFLNLLALSGALAESANATKLLFLGNKNIAPVVYLDHAAPTGVAVDIVRALAPHLPQPVEIKAMDWLEAQALVARGEADALIQINQTEEREKIYDFSEPLLESQFSIFTRTDKVGIAGMASLAGLQVGVEAGGLPRQLLEKFPAIRLTIIPDFLAGFKLLNAGAIDAVVVDYRVGSYVIAENKLRDIRISGEPIAFSYSAIAVKEGNAKLLAAINNALKTIKADGSYQRVIDKWKPKEVVFETREQIRHRIYSLAILVLLLLFLIAAIWTLTLRRELVKRKAAEGRLHRLNRELRAISDCNQVLVRAEDEPTLLKDICRIVCEGAGYRMAWVGYAQDDAGKSVKPVAWAGVEQSYLADANITWADTQRGHGPGGTAIRGGAVVCVQDFATDPQTAPWRDAALQRGYCSCIALPLKDEKAKVFGIFLIYSAEVNAFSPDEARLLEELADDLAFGITVLRTRIKRQQAEEALKNMAAKFRTIYESTSDAIMLLDETGFFDCNAAALHTFGCPTRADLIGQHPSRFSPPQQPGGEDSMSLANQRIAAAYQNGSQQFEWMHCRLDGSEFPADVLLSAMELDGRPVLQATVRDISKRKQSEQALTRAVRALRTLSACNEALVRAGNEAQLLNSICRLIVETGGYSMAWVGFPEQDAAKTVRPVAQYGQDDGFLATANISWADCERGRGPSGMAIRTGTVQVNQEFLTDPRLLPWRQAALERGYQSVIALPLKSAADTLGVLTLYAAASDAFNEAEVTLLQELAGDLAFGIETLRTRTERDRIAHEHRYHEETLRQSLEESIKAIANTVEMRDPYTAGHQRRVGQLAVAIARELGLPEDTNHGIELAAGIHDLGKISIPAEILTKPSRLSSVEYMLLKNHPQAGFDILKDIQFPWPIASMVLQHHERLDGSGYPQGLRGEQILLESRILAVADVVESMASHRPYRAALGIDSALKEMERGRGTAYDAAVVDACLRLFAQKRFAFSS